MKNRKLKYVYGFSDDDLLANRNGELTPRQIQLLHGHRSKNQIGAAVLFCIFLGLVALSGYQLWRWFQRPVGDFPSWWLILGLAGIALSVIIPIASRKEVNTLDKDISEGLVEYHAGMGWREKRVVRTRNGKQTYYYVRVGDFNMGMVDEDTYSAYLSEHYYRLYFLPRSRRVVAAEMIDLSEVNTPPQKSKSMPESDDEAELNTETSYLVYSLRGQGTYLAAIKWYIAQGQPPEVAWQQQDSDAQALHQAALEHLPKVENELQNQGWHIIAQKDEGDISGNAAFRRTYTMERVQIEDEIG